MSVFQFIELFGGLALFLYGMRLMGDGLKKGSSATLKRVMEKVTNNPLMGFLLGMLITALIQSSTATIVLTSGLVVAGILTLHQSLGIILGANVGTTVTAQIIRLLDINASASSWLKLFKPSTLAPLAAILGILLLMLSRSGKLETGGSILMGFGILFTGLLNMTAAVTPLAESPAFSELFMRLTEKPVLGFLAGALVAFCIQSSSATIGILQALSTTGALCFGSIYSVIIGIYLGDCVTTAIVCSIGAKADGKRVGIVHILFNLLEAVLVLGGVTLLHRLGVFGAFWTRPITSGGIANVHTIFNLACALIILPICPLLEKISRRIIKDDQDDLIPVLNGLDESLFASPRLALAASALVLTEMASIARQNISAALSALKDYDEKAARAIQKNETTLNTMTDKVSRYLIKLNPHVKEGADNDLLNYSLKCVSDFERIGDYAVNILENAEQLQERQQSFDGAAWEELRLMGDMLDEVLSLAQKAFSENDVAVAAQVEPLEEVADDLIAELRNRHMARMKEGLFDVDAGYLYMDLLTDIERVSDQCANVGIHTVSLNKKELLNREHAYVLELHKGTDADYNEKYRRYHERYFEKLSTIEA